MKVKFRYFFILSVVGYFFTTCKSNSQENTTTSSVSYFEKIDTGIQDGGITMT